MVLGPASRVNLHYTLDEHSACSMAYLILRTDMQAHESAAVSRKPANSDNRRQSIKHILFHFSPSLSHFIFIFSFAAEDADADVDYNVILIALDCKDDFLN